MSPPCVDAQYYLSRALFITLHSKAKKSSMEKVKGSPFAMLVYHSAAPAPTKFF